MHDTLVFAQYFNIHGQRVCVESFDSKVSETLASDFSPFISPPFHTGDSDVFLLRVLPEKRRPLLWVPLLKTKRSVLFLSRPDERKICFFEKAWVHYLFGKRRCTVFCEDSKAAYETVYLVLLSYIGERLDLKEMHRIRGLGFSFQGKGAILLAKANERKEMVTKGLSEETPLLTKQRKMLAFPQKKSVSNTLEGETKVQWLFLVEPGQKGKTQVEEIHRLQSLWPLIKWLVVGHEIPQVWELYFRPSRQDLKEKAKVLFTRCRLAGELLLQSRVARLETAKDPHTTEEAIEEFLETRD